MNKILTLVGGVLAAGTVWAAGNTYTWDGTTNSWSVASHWGGVLPAAGDTGVVSNGIAQMGAVLSGSPTIMVNTGGIAQATANISVANLVLNGGRLKYDTQWGRTVSGNIVVQSDSWFEFNNGGPQTYTGVLSGGGGLNISNNYANSFNGANYFNNSGSTGYVGTVRIRGATGCHVGIWDNGALGSNNTVSVEVTGTLAVGNVSVSRPVTLNGGQLAVHSGLTFSGPITVNAPSTITGNSGKPIVTGQITSSYPVTLTMGGSGNDGLELRNSANASSWSGGLVLTSVATRIYLDQANSQGTGPICLNGYQLATGPNSGWDMLGANVCSNTIYGGGSIDLKSADWGYTRKNLMMKGNSIWPGGTNVIGSLTVNAATLTLTNNCTLNFKISSGTSYDVLNYAPDATYGSPFKLTLTNASLQVTFMPGLVFPGGYLTIIHNSGTAATAGTFAGLPEGATLNLGGSTNCQITYKYDYDADGKTNDVALYNFTAPLPQVVPSVDNGAGVTNLLSTTAYLCGNVSAGSPTPDAYVCWGTTSAAANTAAWDHVIYIANLLTAFSARVIGLQPGTNYYYRCFATNSVGSAWSSAVAFTAAAPADLYWTNTTWVVDSTAYSWYQAGNWSNRLPYCAGDTGHIPNGFTASPDGELGVAGDRPTIVAEKGSRLYVLSSVSQTPLILAGGQLDFNYHGSTWASPITVTSNSSIVTGTTNNPSDHPITGSISGAAGLTLSTSGSQYWQNNNSNLHSQIYLGPKKFGFSVVGALGSGPVVLDAAARLTWTMDYLNAALTLTNDVSGFGVLYANNSAGCTLSGNQVMPGTVTNAGVLTVNSPLCTLTNATLAINVFDAATYGQLLVTNGTTTLSNALLSIALAANATLPGSNANLCVVRNTGANSLTGRFNSLPEGTTINLGGNTNCQITYAYCADGDSTSNDIALYNFAVTVLPSITVSPATNVTATSACLNGTLLGIGMGQPGVWVYWGTNSGGTNASNWATNYFFGTNSAAIPASYTFQAALTPNQSYVYRYYAQNATGGVWSLEQSFTTFGPPVLDNGLGVTSLGTTYATLNGTLAITGGSPTAVTIYWGTDSSNWANTNSLGTRSAGPFSNTITTLWYGNRYYYQCFATNGWGGTNTAPVSFNTARPGAAALFLTNAPVSGLTATSATLTVNVAFSGSVYNATLFWGSNNGGTNASAWSNSVPLGWYTNLQSTSYPYTLTGLASGTTYSATFWATNALDNLWATNVVTFATYCLPAVNVYGGATNLKATAATLQGQVTAGNPAPQAYLCWGTSNPGGSNTNGWQNVTAFGAQSGFFSTNVTGLASGATTYYRCYATNSLGDSYADTSLVTPLFNTYTFTNNNQNWSLASSWSPFGGPPASSSDYGIVPAGMTAVANADLAGGPTVRIDPGGTVKATAAVAPNLILNGGKVRMSVFGLILSGTLNVQTDSWFQFENGGKQQYTGVLSGSGALSITNSGGSTFNGANYFVNSASTGFVGAVHIYGDSAYHVGIYTNGALGSNNAIYVESNGTLAIEANLSRPVTLNGGTCGVEVNCNFAGPITVTAPSALSGHYGTTRFSGQIISSYPLPIYSSDDASTGTLLQNTNNMTTWSGGLEVVQKRVYLTAAGAQGSGPVTIRSGAELWTGHDGGFDLTGANAFTNDLSGSGGMQIRDANWGFNLRNLELKGGTITPGGTGAVGTLTFNAASLTLLTNGATPAKLKIEINASNSYDVVQYGANSAGNNNGSQKVTLNGVDLAVTLLSGATFPGPNDRLVILRDSGTNSLAGTFNGLPEGGALYLGGSTNCLITYKYDFEGDGKSNDVALYNFGAPEVSVRNDNPSMVSTSSASLNGTLNASGASDAHVFLFWGTSDSGSNLNWANTIDCGVTNTQAGAVSFSNVVATLSNNATYFYTYYATNGTANCWPPSSKQFVTYSWPSVNNGTGAVAGVGTATLCGQLAVTGGVPTQVAVYWGTDTNAWANTNDLGALAVGPFSTAVSNLYYGLPYWYRCYASNAWGVSWAASPTNFTTTRPGGGAIALTNASATGLTATSAVLNATLACSGSVYNVGVYWGTSNGGTNATAWGNSVSLGAFVNVASTGLNYAVTTLASNTTYYYAFRATNALDTVWATNVPNFQTYCSPVVTVYGGATNLKATAATLPGQVTAGNPAPQAYICWGTSNPGGSNTNGWQNVAAFGTQSGVFSTNVIGLSAGATTYYRCYATNSLGDNWADASFVTPLTDTYVFTNSGANWSLASSWSPFGGPPTNVTDYGIVPAGMTAVASTDLGASGSRPIVRVDTGGTVSATAAISPTLVLNGGRLRINGYGVILGGTLNVQTDSWFQFENGGPQAYTGVLSGSGSLSITNLGGNVQNGANYFNNSASTGFVGTVHICGNSAYHVAIRDNGALGSNNVVSVESNGTLAVYLPSLTRPVTLNGGTLSVVVNCNMNGTVTATAPSILQGYYGSCYIYGQIVSPYLLTVYGVGNQQAYGLRIKNANNLTSWTGGMDIPSNRVYIESAGSQGCGPVTIRSSGLLMAGLNNGFDLTGANAFTNDLSSSGVIDLPSQDGGSTRQKLELKGNSIAPGGIGAVDTMTINASSLTLTNNGATKARLKIDVSSGSIYDVLKFDPLGYAPKQMTLNGVSLQVSLLPGFTVPGPSVKLHIVQNAGDQPIAGTFDGLTNNATVDFGGGTNCQITYTADFDGDGKSNDVALYNFYADVPTAVPVVDNGAGVTNLLASSCYLSGNVSQGTPAPDAYVCYGLTSAGDNTGAWDHVVYVNPYAGSGPFSIRVVQLSPGSNYYYRCFATNTVGSAWSSASNFVTPAAASLIWTNTAWVDNSSIYFWSQAGNWSNRLPACAGDTGYIPNGRTANIDGDLGASGDRPTIVAQPGGRLYLINSFWQTPVVLAGGTFDMNFRSATLGGPVTLTADSLLSTGGSGNPSDHPITGSLAGAANLTLTTAGSQYWQANNSNLHCRLHLGTGKFGFTDTGALGNGPLVLDSGVHVTWYMDYNNYALTLTNDVSGFGTLYANNVAGCTLKGNTVMPGVATNAGTLTVNSPLCTLTNATLAINVFGSGAYGQLLVTNGACTLANANLALTLGYNATSTDRLFVVLQSGTNPITGTFNGLPEGAVTTVSGPGGCLWKMTISYTNSGDGGSVGNDVLLYNIVPPAPGTVFKFR